MNAPKRSRARVLTPEGLQKLRERVRSHEADENAGFKYTLERLGELTGLDPETVKNVLDCKGSDKRTISRCFESFGLTLTESDHTPAAQATNTADPNFVGRDEAIADLNTLVSRNARVIVIQARGGVGKTTLARKYLQQAFGSFLEFPIAKETKDIASIEGLLEEKLRQLGEEPGREFLVSLDRLKRKLQAERIGILIDNLEPALDSAGKFIEAHRRYVELLRVLSDPIVQSITLITSRERLREADVTVQHYPLRSLDVQAWSQFFQSRSINVETPALATLHDAYGGNAKAMDIISGAVLEDFSGDVEAYWQANQDDLFIERDLEDLVTKQFDRLHQLDPDAYNLLCRMGCYRYQDVPAVPIEGLFRLLWDVPANRHRRVVKSLQDRSLVDFEDGDFWLHPVIRAEAISKLRTSGDWETTNHKAAVFWTDSVKTIEVSEDALKAIEAYYHYTMINDFERACLVILKERDNRWQKSEYLGQSLHRLSLLKQADLAVTQIIEHIQSAYFLSRLYILSSNSYRLAGNIYKSIDCLEKSRRIANESNFKMTELYALRGLGICYITLWELEKASNTFEDIKNIISCSNNFKNSSEPNEFYTHKDTGSWYFSHLAFINSCLGYSEKSSSLAESGRVQLYKENLSTRTLGDSLLFLGSTYENLRELDKAFEFYGKALKFAEESGYQAVKAIALIGLANLCRGNKKSEPALSYYSEAIQIAAYLGDKCVLAEGHYQLALTYQMMGKALKGNQNFQQAIQFFSEMEAPKQVERVRQSMQKSN